MGDDEAAVAGVVDEIFRIFDQKSLEVDFLPLDDADDEMDDVIVLFNSFFPIEIANFNMDVCAFSFVTWKPDKEIVVVPFVHNNEMQFLQRTEYIFPNR